MKRENGIAYWYIDGLWYRVYCGMGCTKIGRKG